MVNETKNLSGILQKSIKAQSLQEHGGCLWISVNSSDLIHSCTISLSNGAIFDSAFVSSRSGGSFVLYYVFRISGKMLVIQAQGNEFSALSSKFNSALWDERKIQDLTGLKLTGIPDSRPLVFHNESGMPNSYPVGDVPAKWKNTDYRITGTGADGEFEIAVGPVHAGIIEPGHFRFHVVGETINKLETRMFYLHRGVEKSLENKSASEVLPMIESISGDESVANSVAYCNAIENALGLKIPERAEFIRAIFMELERLYSHLSDLGGMPTDVGFYFSASRFAVLREDMMRLNHKISGNRFLRGMCIIGGVKSDLEKDKLSHITTTLKDFERRLQGVERLTLTSSTYLDRVFSSGVVPLPAAIDLALIGPVARACGISCDLRKTNPYSIYSKIPFNESVEKTGDVLGRYLVKLGEVKESLKIIHWLMTHLPAGPLSCEIKVPSDEEADRIGIGWSEAPRGGSTFLVELSEEGKLKRVACKTPSFRNWRGIEMAGPGNIVPDFPLINKSFNMSYAGTDL